MGSLADIFLLFRTGTGEVYAASDGSSKISSPKSANKSVAMVSGWREADKNVKAFDVEMIFKKQDAK